jgi:hypothetical protein
MWYFEKQQEDECHDPWLLGLKLFIIIRAMGTTPIESVTLTSRYFAGVVSIIQTPKIILLVEWSS